MVRQSFLTTTQDLETPPAVNRLLATPKLRVNFIIEDMMFVNWQKNQLSWKLVLSYSMEDNAMKMNLKNLKKESWTRCTSKHR